MSTVTVKDVEALAVKFDQIFHVRSLRRGPQNNVRRYCVILLAGTVGYLLAGLLSMIVDADTTLVLHGFAVLYEVLAIWLVIVFYEPVYREFVFKQEGLIKAEASYLPANTEHYKTTWLNRHLPVSPADYLILIENLEKNRSLSQASKRSTEILADRVLRHVFRLTPLRFLLSIPVLALMINLGFRLIDAAKLDMASHALELVHQMPGYLASAIQFACASIVIVVSASLLYTLAHTWYMNKRKRCTAIARDRLVQAILNRASLAPLSSEQR